MSAESEHAAFWPQKKSFPWTATLYIAREFLLSFAIAFCFFFVVFLINQILLLAEDILSKNAPLSRTLLLLVYSLPSVVAIAFPFSALAGALMASARLNSDNEILAFSATGVSVVSLYTPFLIIGLLASLASFASNDYFLPRASKSFQKSYAELVARSAGIELAPFTVKRYADALVVTGQGAGDRIGDLVLYQSGSRDAQKLIAARYASVEMSQDGAEALLSMEQVLEHDIASGKDRKFSVSKADSVLYRFKLRQPIVGFGGVGPSEMSSRELLASIGRKKKVLDARLVDIDRQKSETRARLLSSYSTAFLGAREESQALRTSLANLRQAASVKPADRTLQIYYLEYHKKFAIPAAGFFFSLLAFPLGLGTKKAGRTAGFGIALLLSTAYWGLLFAGQSAGLRNGLSPMLAMWTPNILVAFAAFVTWIVRHSSSRRAV